MYYDMLIWSQSYCFVSAAKSLFTLNQVFGDVPDILDVLQWEPDALDSDIEVKDELPGPGNSLFIHAADIFILP